MSKDTRYPYYKDCPDITEIFGPMFYSTPSLRKYELRDSRIYLREYNAEAGAIQLGTKRVQGSLYYQFQFCLGKDFRSWRSKPEFGSIDTSVFFSRMKDTLLEQTDLPRLVLAKARSCMSEIMEVRERINRSIISTNPIVEHGDRIMRAYLDDERDPELLDIIRGFFDKANGFKSTAHVDISKSRVLLKAVPTTGIPVWYIASIGSHNMIRSVSVVDSPTDEHINSMIGLLNLQLSSGSEEFRKGGNTAFINNAAIHVDGRFTMYVIPDPQ